MTYSYNTSVPATNNNPSTDQPDMLTNTQSINSIIGVDHVSFNTASGGTHQQVTFSSKNTPAAQTDPQSVLYTASGTGSSNALLSFRNAAQIFPISIIKAYARFTFAAPSTVTIQQSFNISSITCASATSPFVINFTTAMATSNYGVFLTPSFGSGSGFIISALTPTTSSLTITVVNGSSNVPSIVSLMIVEL